MANELIIRLTVDDQGTIKLKSAKGAVEELHRASVQGSADSKAAADDFAGALVRKLGLYAALTAAAYGLGHALVSGFKSGIQAVDEFRVSTIGIAATLTDMAAETGNIALTYAGNLGYAKEMYRALELEAAKHFGTATDLQQSFTIMVQKGVVAREEDVAALGTLVDKIKLMTQGQNQQIQIAQELRALVDGQARATSQLALMLRDQLGPEWENLVKKHREEGDLIQWLASLFPGLQFAVDQIANTWTAQRTTLESYLKIVGREGLGGAYDWLVEKLKEANRYLEKNQYQVGTELRVGWENVRPAVQTVLDLIVSIGWATAKAAQGVAAVVGAASRTSESFKSMAALTGEFSLYEEAEASRAAERRSMELARYGTAMGGYLASLPGKLAATRPPGGAGEEAGKGAEAAQRKIENIIDTLSKEWARLAEGLDAEIDSWAAHTLREIDRVAGHDIEKQEALVLLHRVAALKKAKVEEDYWKWLAGAYGDAYAKIDAEMAEQLRKFKGNKEREREIHAWAEREKWKASDDFTRDLLGRQKSYLDALASGLPFLSQQLALKGRALDLEIALGHQTLERWIYEKRLAGLLSDAQADELRGLEALTIQMKRFNLEREKWMREGIGGGVRTWAYERTREGETSLAEFSRTGLRDLERGIASTFSRGIVGALKTGKTDFAEIGWGIAESFIDRTVELAVGQLFIVLAQGFLESSLPMVAGAAAAGVELNIASTTAAGMLVSGGVGAGAALIAAATAAAAILSSASVGFFGLFHQGGVVMHSGGQVPLYAHAGLSLGPEERLIVAQTGEGILPRETMARLGPARFEALRRGEFETRGGGKVVNISIPKINILVTQRLTPGEADDLVRRTLVPAINRQLGRFGKQI